MKRRAERTVLVLILILFAALSAIYSIVVPPFEASDELWHYPMVKYVADHWDLPVQDPTNVGPWRQEGSQPPLYYAVAAAVTFWIDTSDMEQVRHLNPHVDNGIATPDGNINLVVHNPALERFPWRGAVLAVHLIRFLSVLMGVAAVYFTYRIADECLATTEGRPDGVGDRRRGGSPCPPQGGSPLGRASVPAPEGWATTEDRPYVALAAAAVHAFTPMFVFISGAVNNDNLALPLCGLGLWMLLRLAKEQEWTTRQALGRYLALGVVLGLGALTKTSALGLAVVTAVIVGMRAVRRRSWKEFIVGGLATGLPVVGIAGWWYLRNLRLYGDLTGLNMFTEILGTREVPASLAQLWRERFSFLAGYWGNFGGLNVLLPAWVYAVLNVLLVLAGLGFLLFLLRVSASPRLRVALSLCLLWALLVLLPWIGWARVTWSSQGRLVFPAISVWSLLLVLGLRYLGSIFQVSSPRLAGHWSLVIGHSYLLLPIFLLFLSIVAPFAWIAPAYTPPESLTDEQVAAIPHRLEAQFGRMMRLLGYELETDAVEPAGQVGVTLYWEALAPADRDYTVFVHLLGEGDLLVAQRDTFPGLGLLSTTWLEPGQTWADRYVLQVPATAYSPDAAQIEVGLYDAVTGTRLPAVGPGREPLGDHLRFGRVQIRARSADYPNSISVNFGDRMALVGYDLSERVVRPGETITLTLYWHGLRPMEANYTISVQLVDTEQRKAAQHDGWPLDGAAPTAGWEPGQALTDVRTLSVYPDAPPGVYGVRVAVYVLEAGEIVHLPVIPEGGQMPSNCLMLTRVRVAP